MKINVVKVVSVIATVLTLGGSLMSAWASDKKTKETIAKLVDEKLSSK